MTKNKVISDMIHSLRKHYDMTNEDIGTKLGIRDSSYRRKELNKSEFTLDELIMLSNVFNFSIYINNKKLKSSEQFRDIVIDTRTKKEISQDVLRIYVGMATLATYSRKENGKAYFKMGEVFKICEFLYLNFKIKYKEDIKKIDLDHSSIKSEFKQVICIEDGKIYDNTNKAAEAIDTGRQYIWALCQKGGGKDSDGKTWMYLEDYIKKVANSEEKEIDFN